MFDVSFSELVVIAVVALLVIGPEKLPKVARTVGAFTGRMQRYMAQVKEEVNRELRFEELQKLQQEIKQSVEQETADLQVTINDANEHALSSNAELNTVAPKKRALKKSLPVKPFMARESETPTPKATVHKAVVTKSKTKSTAKVVASKEKTASKKVLTKAMPKATT